MKTFKCLYGSVFAAVIGKVALEAMGIGSPHLLAARAVRTGILPLFQCLRRGRPLVARVGAGGDGQHSCAGSSPQVIHRPLVFCRPMAHVFLELQALDKQPTSFQVSFPHFFKQWTLAAKTVGKHRHKNQFSKVSSYQVK